MSFNPYGDQLTFKLKKFTVKKSSDFLGGKAEVYYIAVFLDAGINSDGNVDSWFSYQPGAGTIDVKRGDSYTYANPPALYGAASPGQQLNYSVLFYDSDEKTRNIAGDIQGAVDNPAVVAALTRYGDAMEKTAIQAATVAAAASAAARAACIASGVAAGGVSWRRATYPAINTTTAIRITAYCRIPTALTRPPRRPQAPASTGRTGCIAAYPCART